MKIIEAGRHIGLLLVSASILAAAAPVATISSSGTFELRGKSVRTEGVPSWPMMAGDEVGTSAGSAEIRFRDGSRVTLNPNSRAKVEKTETGLVFRLQAGEMEFAVAPKSTVTFYNRAAAVPAQAGVTTTASTGEAVAGAAFKRYRILPPPPPPASGR